MLPYKESAQQSFQNTTVVLPFLLWAPDDKHNIVHPIM